MMSSGSAPIATSTPVNFASGPVSPPPLTLAAGPGPLHQEQPFQPTSAAKVASYPAVLKGRTAASPPNPNLVPSGKIPPPVPPRGTGQSRTRFSEEQRGPGTATSTSSMASSRGDEAAIITRYRLHDSSSIPHHPPSPDNTSAVVSAAPAVTTNISVVATTSFYDAANSDFSSTSNVHVSASSPDHQSPRDGPRNTIFETARELPRRWNDWTMNVEEEEFVSVEQVDGSYVIRTSPQPFRPERGNFKHPRITTETNPDDENKDSGFRSFPNSASKLQTTGYKMSRKDKKHSETYYERMKRKQRELEASIATITTIARRTESKMADGGRIEASKANRSIVRGERNEERTFAEHRRESRLLKKIREKSAQRRKKLAPEPSSVSQTFGASTKMKYYSRKIETSVRKEDRGERLEKFTSNVEMVRGNQDEIIRLRTEKRIFLLTKVDEIAKCKNDEAVGESKMAAAKIRDSSLVRTSANNEIYYNNASDSMWEQPRKKRNEKSNFLKPLTDKLKGGRQERSTSNVLIPNASFLHGYGRSSGKNF